ncbi:hypothetical protein FACS189456_4740 [Bacteroidia bacterium]|nr:hypothetical protein FACS189456_4740 [Bacteroidia bacterium]
MYNPKIKYAMKKIKILCFATLAFGIMGLSGCNKDENKDSYGLAKVTTFPTLELTQGEEVWLAKGGSFQDPGYVVEHATGNVVVEGSVNMNTAGMYSLNYTATNAEGYSVTKTRKVFVADPTGQTGLEGTYTSNIHRVPDNSATAPGNRGPFDLTLTAVSGMDGYYYIIDLLGGWYVIGGGASYAAYGYKGYIRIGTDGAMTILWSGTTPWADEGVLAPGVPATYDFGTNTLTFTSRMSTAAYNFEVTLVKQ